MFFPCHLFFLDTVAEVSARGLTAEEIRVKESKEEISPVLGRSCVCASRKCRDCTDIGSQ